MKEALLSCAAMLLAMSLGLAYGAVADLHAPVSADSFPIVGAMSVVSLAIAAFRPASRGRVSGREHRGLPWVCAALAAFAVLLMALDTYRAVSQDSLVYQSLSILPFLLVIGYSVRCRAWLATCGAAGFVSVAVAMLFCNRRGGWAGFFSIYCA